MENSKKHYIWLLIILVVPAIILSLNKIKLGLDLRGGTSVVLQAQGKIDKDTMNKVRDIIERRVNSLGVAEPVIQISGNDKLIVELAGIKDVRSKSLGTTNARNIVNATMEGLKNLKRAEDIARLRGKSVEEILG